MQGDELRRSNGKGGVGRFFIIQGQDDWLYQRDQGEGWGWNNIPLVMIEGVSSQGDVPTMIPVLNPIITEV